MLRPQIYNAFLPIRCKLPQRRYIANGSDYSDYSEYSDYSDNSVPLSQLMFNLFT